MKLERALIALLLCIPAASIAWIWRGDGRLSIVDPIVTVVRLSDRSIRTSAVFSPRLRTDGDIEYSHTFELLNDSPSELVIDQKSKSCGCLSAEISSEHVLPGAKAFITLRVRPDNLVSKEATYTLTSTADDRFIFALRTHTYPLVMLEGSGGRGALIAFGLAEANGRLSSRRRLLLYSLAGSLPPELRLSQSFEGLKCQMADCGVESVEDGKLVCRAYDLDLTVVGQSSGLHTKELRFESVDRERSEYDFAVRVVWNVDEPVSIEPERWVLRRDAAPMSGVLSQGLRLRLSKGRPFLIRHVECPKALAVELTTQGMSAVHDAMLSLDLDEIPAEKSFLGKVEFHLTPDSVENAQEGLPDQKEIVRTFHVTVADDDS